MLRENAAIRGDSRSIEPIPFTGLLTNKLLAALPGDEFARLLPHLEPVTLNTGTNLYEFGEGVTFVYFPETAVVSHLHFLEDGGATAAAIIGREGIVGLSIVLDNQPATYWTQVTVGGSALRMETEVIKDEFNRGEALQHFLLAYTSSRLAQVSQRAVCNSRHRLDERLCTWLLMIRDRASDELLPLTHETIADHLGARRAGITGACNALRDGGVIDYRRGQMRIINRPMLESAACECYRMLA